MSKEKDNDLGCESRSMDGTRSLLDDLSNGRITPMQYAQSRESVVGRTNVFEGLLKPVVKSLMRPSDDDEK